MKTSGKLKQTLSLAGLRCGDWVLVTAFISHGSVQLVCLLSCCMPYLIPCASSNLKGLRIAQPLLVTEVNLMEGLCFPCPFGGCVSSSC